MSRFLKVFVLIFAIVLIIGCNGDSSTGPRGGGCPFNPDITYGSFTDPRNSKKYHTVEIGTQTWFAENLNYAGVDGDVGVCYDNQRNNCAKYGRLYTWTESMNIDSKYDHILWNGNDANHQGICPNGWRLPNDSDWDILAMVAGGERTSIETALSFYWWREVGEKLKSKSGWDNDDWSLCDVDGNCITGGSGNGTDNLGFSALPGGYTSDGDFSFIGSHGYWWTATESDISGAWIRYMDVAKDMFGADFSKNFGASVRCVK
ncbi:MAG: hypothetical protein FWE57_05450 [Chitinispirillia bacterium]|nr:hypothetical protein [Chitinispirillia bacterium]